ncbi:low-density lipoprotein receptor-related protein 4-like [Dendronephthya gigantea]|uniref:low-density lipoprotein receptor-related protein 4-like n=1 Tax=Dendronephthya gigantea TaxID=151771 RepID=UPI001069093F|nr:low-density lipoprotein receptor-related protein 4-like [Dendronephthya gigantea]
MWKHEVSLLFVTLIQCAQISKGENGTCAVNEFTCKDGECILSKWECDGEPDCSDHSDEKDCDSYPTCSSSQFQCNITKDCVDEDWRCDGDIDCGDSTDERNCYNTPCTDEDYRCKNGKCVPEAFRCDGVDDCEDFSDEALCDTIIRRCQVSEFRCDSQNCIPLDWQCDGFSDCNNGKDEDGCVDKCLSHEWKCDDGKCILAKYRCDGDKDCKDRSDELGCGNETAICSLKSHFNCTSGKCIYSDWKCDDELDCDDGSDENNCGCPSSGNVDNNCTKPTEAVQKNYTHGCLRTQFRCYNDKCVEMDKVCNRKDDCGDKSDELRCPTWENQTSCGPNQGGCEHKCSDEGGVPECSCFEGFYPDKSDFKRCVDIDECNIPGFCSQLCRNDHGGYKCSCHKGYVLQSNGRKCKALGPKPLLALSDQGMVSISALATPKKIETIAQDVGNIAAVDYWFEGDLIFWADTDFKTIKSASLNGSLMRDVVKFGLEMPCGLVVDWMGRKVFWTDSESGRIEMSNFDGTQRKAIFWQPLGKLRAIALHPSKGYMFWTEWDLEGDDTTSSITRANMDGTDVQRIRYRDIYWPNALTVDYLKLKIYFVDAKTGLIELSDFDGSFRITIRKDNLMQPFSISLFEDDIYWTDTNKKGVYKMNKFDGSGINLVQRNLNYPMGLAVIHTSRQPHGSYNCEKNNGGCSHICLPTSSGRSCACPTGFQMSNLTHCSEKIDKFVAYVADYSIRQISLDTGDMLDVVLPFENVLDVIAMDWDPVKDEMYWADIYNDEITIRKGKMRPAYNEAVLHQIPGKLSGIAVDWLSRKLYWSDEERNHILVSNLDGSSTTVLRWKNNNQPRNLLLHVEKRYMYWTTHGKAVSINRAGMDGLSRKKIVSKHLTNPTGLCIDKLKNIIFWVDGGDIVHYFALATEKRNFFKVSHHSLSLTPFSIGVHKDRFFWADSSLKKVLSMNLGDTNSTRVIGKYTSNPARLAVFAKMQTSENHPCSIRNGGCSHLCLLSPSQGYRCLCPAGRHLKADNKTCESVQELTRFVLVNSNGRLHQVPLSVPYKTEIALATKGNKVKDIIAFDVDVKRRNVYFIRRTKTEKEICFVSLFGGDNTCILSEILRAPYDIAYDPVRHYFYWTDAFTRKIYLADSNGTFWTVVIWKNLDEPSSITVAYQHGFIFWADVGEHKSIFRANMDGSSSSKIVTTGLKWPYSLTVDHVTKHLYWTDFPQERIEFCDYEGKNRRQIATTSSGLTSLSLFSKFVYWSEWKPGVLRKSGKAQKIFNFATVIKGMKRVFGIQAVNLQKIPVSKSDCENNNGNCSHFCVMNPVGISCACPVGLKLREGGKICYDSPHRSIFFISGKTMNRISFDTDDLTSFPLPVKNMNITRSFIFNVIEDKIYWTDGTTIYSTRMKDSVTKIIVISNSSSINSLSVDWISGNLFWSDLRTAKIKVSTLNGSHSADLITGALEKPRDIAVDAAKGLLFWTDAGRKVIERSHTDGQSHTVVVSGDVYQPVGLVLDEETEFLYWSEAMTYSIERCNYDGQRRSTVVKKGVYASGLTILGSQVFWADYRQRALLHAHKETGAEVNALEKDLEIPMALAAFTRRTTPVTSPCFMNGNCSNICLSKPNGRSCATVCDKILHLRDSCVVKKIISTQRSIQPSRSCTMANGDDNCTNITVNFRKGRKSMTIAYIVAGIVCLVFVLTMTILIFLCYRRFKSRRSKRRQKQLMALRVTFENKRTTSKEDTVNDPLVTISSQRREQLSTRSSPSIVQEEERDPCLAISEV